MEAMLICALNLRHMIAIPMGSNDPVNKQGILGSSTGHGFFEEDSVAHGFVDARAELVQESVFHMAGEFLQGKN